MQNTVKKSRVLHGFRAFLGIFLRFLRVYARFFASARGAKRRRNPRHGLGRNPLEPRAGEIRHSSGYGQLLMSEVGDISLSFAWGV